MAVSTTKYLEEIDRGTVHILGLNINCMNRDDLKVLTFIRVYNLNGIMNMLSVSISNRNRGFTINFIDLFQVVSQHNTKYLIWIVDYLRFSRGVDYALAGVFMACVVLHWN